MPCQLNLHWAFGGLDRHNCYQTTLYILNTYSAIVCKIIEWLLVVSPVVSILPPLLSLSKVEVPSDVLSKFLARNGLKENVVSMPTGIDLAAIPQELIVSIGFHLLHKKDSHLQSTPQATPTATPMMVRSILFSTCNPRILIIVQYYYCTCSCTVRLPIAVT